MFLPYFQTSADNAIGFLFNILWVVFVMAFLFYGNRLQIYLSLRRVGKDLRSLQRMSGETEQKIVAELSKYGSEPAVVKQEVGRLLGSIMIEPVSMDPSGVVFKLDHVIKTYEAYFKSKVARVTPGAEKVVRQNLSNLVEVGMALDFLFRYVRHLYTSAKKYNDLFAVVQLQMLMPTLMDTAGAYFSASDAFTAGQPIGDSLGPMVASKLMQGAKAEPVAEETVYAEVTYEGRKLLVVRAEGPGGTVGRPGEAVEKLLDMHPDAELVVTVDAALKLEGEESGEVAEGVGAAIGGPGVDRYRIEGAATKRNVPMYAIVVKMSEKEAITKLKDELQAKVDDVLRRFKRLIEEKTKPDAIVLFAGIGNTIGVS
ncbi:MAG: DUF1512 domain-containing protein [Nitrososphaerota archaeon]|nr:DUF1512 domain-containing protein [Nitrososphaerota archaeon]MDG6940350.1 DUF1512 domain-containing protein [Nitrososphaerota archaeon]